MLPSCIKEDTGNEWAVCYECTIDSWIGEYEGTANHFNGSSNSNTENLPMTVRIEETGNNYLTAYIIVPNFYSTTLSGEFTNSYSVSFASSGSSLNATIYEFDKTFKLTGSSKKFEYKAGELVINESISFDAPKLNQ